MLRDTPRIKLGAYAIREALKASNLDGSEVDQVFMGTCMPNLTGVLGRQAALDAGMPENISAFTIDRACCSGMSAVGLAFREIKAGEARICVAGGMENMSETPYILPHARWGRRLGDILVEDRLVVKCPQRRVPVALDAGEVALEYGISREDQDAWALRSHCLYLEAYKKGFFQDEIVPMQVPDPEKKGSMAVLDRDEQVREDITLEKLARLPTVYGSPTVTAGNASGLNDGAAALVIMDRQEAEKRGLEILGTIVASVSIAGRPRYTACVPAEALQKALFKTGLRLNDLKIIEINEAFAAMPLVSSKILSQENGVPLDSLRERINCKGGAIAIGHPVGATGARLVMTLAYELMRRGGGYGGAAICGGAGLADAVILRVD
jgi:acetyl-CoA C-acetyltransferase